MNIKEQTVGLDVRDESVDMMADLNEGNIATAVKEAIDVPLEPGGDETHHSSVVIPFRQRRKRVAEPDSSRAETVEKVEETVSSEKETTEKDGQVAVAAPPKEWIKVKRKPLYDFIKRTFDIVVSLICLTVGLPVYLIMILAIVIDDPGNPFFVQERVGLNGRTFRMVKLRTMYKDAEKHKCELKNECASDVHFKMKNDPRVTRVGRFLRATSLDESTQAINVLFNSMSVVGPRSYISSEQACLPDDRLQVKPGLTWYWQITDTTQMSYEDQLELDYKYIRERGIRTDLKLIWMTIKAVLKGRNY